MSSAASPASQGNETHFQSVTLTKYEDGELHFVSRDGEDKVDTDKLKEASIISITESSSLGARSSEGGYFINSLMEDSTNDGPFQLLTSKLVDPPPRQLLDKYLVPSNTPNHLRCDATHRLTVVVSTHSGLCQAETFYSRILKGYLQSFGLEETQDWSPERDQDKYELVLTKSDQTVRDLGKELSRPLPTGQARTIILLSGDGGVVDLINGSTEEKAAAAAPPPGPKPTIILLPLGTGNALFHSLHKPLYAAAPTEPSPYVLALRTLLRGVPAPLPTFEAVFAPGSRLISYSDAAEKPDEEEEEQTGKEQTRAVSRLTGAIVASYGFHASLVWESDTPAYRKHGAQRFQMAAAELLKLGHGYEVDVEVRLAGSGAEEEWTRVGREGDRFGYVLATLVSSLEKTFTISPDSAPLDGRLRLVTFGDVGGERTMDVMKAAYDGGSHVGMKWTGADGKEEGVGYWEVDEVRVTVREEDARWRKVCIDGTIVELPARGGWMRVRRVPESRFNILVDRTVV